MAIASHWLDMRLPNHNLPALRQALALLEQENTQVHRKLDLVRRWNGPSPATSAWAARSKGFPPN